MESEDALQPSRRTSPLVVISLVLSILSILAIVATIIATAVFEDTFTPPPGHSSVLMSSGAWVFYLLSCLVMFTLPVAIILAIIALLLIRNHPEKYGSRRLAWIALVIALLPVAGGMCILMIPFLMISLASAPAPTMIPIIVLTTLTGEWSGTDITATSGR